MAYGLVAAHRRYVTRPRPSDQPSDDELAVLHAELLATVAERQRLNAASAVRGPGSRRAHVSLEGEHAWLALTEHGQVLAERTVTAAWLLEQLDGSPVFEDLEKLITPEPGRGERDR